MNRLFFLLFNSLLILCCAFIPNHSIAKNVVHNKQKAKHVVFIGIDGWGAYSVSKAEIPAIKKLMVDGSYTLEKRSVLPSSSAVNWASMFMGAGPELHGYTEWGSRVPELPSRIVNENGMFPTIFKVLRDVRPDAEIGCLYEWKGIEFLIDTLALNYYAQAKNANEQPDQLCTMAEIYIKNKKPTLLAVCFDNLDHIGHKDGHDTPAYYTKLTELDSYVARIVQAVKVAGLLDDTIFILTSDHGGINRGHGGKTMQEMQSPFIISGKNVKVGLEFHESMMQYDIASTIAYILGVNQPQVWIGRSMTQVFE